MNGPAKLRRKTPAATGINAKPKSGGGSRNPLRELSNGRLAPAHSGKGLKGGCFGFLLTNSSSSSVSSTASSSSSSRVVLPGSPKSAPLGSRALRPLDAHGAPPGGRSRATQMDVSGGARPRFRSVKQSRTDEQRKPTGRSILPRRNRGRAGSEGWSLQEEDAVEGGRRAATGDAKSLIFQVASEDGDGATSRSSPTGRGALPAHLSETRLGFDLEEGGAQLFHGPVLDATPGKEEGQQPSHSPASTTTATPPVQASISPELGTHSALPTPSCFAAGYLIAGVQDRRKCRPRGFLTGGDCGLEIADGDWLGSSGAPGSGGRRVSLTPPPPLEASVHWLSSSPCDDNSGRLGSSAISSCNKKAPLGVSPAEASVHWFLSPLADATDARVLEDFPSAASEPTGDSPGFGSLLGMDSSPFEKTPSGVEICCSPATNSSVSPFSLIIQKAVASARGSNHSLRGKGRRHRCGSVVNSSFFSGDSRGGSNVICTPSTCSCSSGQVGSFPAFDQQAMGEAVETLNPSSPLCKFLSSETQELLSFSPPKSGDTSTPSNSISLSCFRRPSWRWKSVKEESHAREEWVSSSEMKVSWREGLISRMFEMDEFNHNAWASDKENVGSHGEELGLQPDIKLDKNLGSSMIKDVNDQFATDGFESFEFVGHKQNGEKGEVKVCSPTPIPCAESLRIDMDVLAVSDDSDWNLFFKNNLFEV